MFLSAGTGCRVGVRVSCEGNVWIVVLVWCFFWSDFDDLVSVNFELVFNQFSTAVVLTHHCSRRVVSCDCLQYPNNEFQFASFGVQ